MPETNFIDYVTIACRSGRGGPGSVHFRREKFVPKGGPDGGDGGRGGHVIMKGNAQLWTLLHLRYQRHIFAENGQPGAGAQKHGSDGSNRIIEVPLGTVAKDAQSGEVLGEILEHDETCILLKGGQGGKGNVHFKSATNQTPRYAQPGEAGSEQELVFELKVLADVGLVGFPNAGKSTLLSVLSAAKPEIADYPFTTLTPNLGIVEYRDERSFVMADIPGIIEGAHLGKGLGIRFLRHIERNSILLFLVPADSNDIQHEYHTLLHELSIYNRELMDKDRILLITKSDLLDGELMKEMLHELPDVESLFISSVSGMGLMELKDRVWSLINEQKT